MAADVEKIFKKNNLKILKKKERSLIGYIKGYPNINILFIIIFIFVDFHKLSITIINLHLAYKHLQKDHLPLDLFFCFLHYPNY